MEITLRIDGKDQTFKTDFVSAAILRDAMAINKMLIKLADDEDGTLDAFNSLAGFVVKVFDEQFTEEQVWDGIAAHKMEAELVRIYKNILNGTGE